MCCLQGSDRSEQQDLPTSIRKERIAMTTIAVIEDDPALLALVQELFDERDWFTLALRESDHAVETLHAAQPDAVLLDLYLGGQHSGWHILEALQGEPSTHLIPIVIWSGDATSMKDKQAWLEARNVQVLPKPFDIDELYACLDQALQSQGSGSHARLTA
jgi:two-component system, OmpR family, phosphate regulon response regulator PhoB